MIGGYGRGEATGGEGGEMTALAGPPSASAALSARPSPATVESMRTEARSPSRSTPASLLPRPAPPDLRCLDSAPDRRSAVSLKRDAAWRRNRARSQGPVRSLPHAFLHALPTTSTMSPAIAA